MVDIMTSATNIVSMYAKHPAYIIGFHGCSEAIYNKVIKENKPLQPSNNTYDWLGKGIYFWENNYQRAVEWARNKYKDDGRVIGALIDLGFCLDLNDLRSAPELKKAYQRLKKVCLELGEEMPKNQSGGSKTDELKRDLDCSVIEMSHLLREIKKEVPYDSVRGLFTEGAEMYPGSGFTEKAHIQVSIINPNCIKGYFSPLEFNNKFSLP